MKYLITVWTLVCTLVYGGWLFVLEASSKVDPTEKTCVMVSVCVWLALFLYLAIFKMDKGGEEIRLPEEN